MKTDITSNLATKYRPSTLDDIVGQDVAIKVLKNSLLAKRIYNAYLFYGIQGTGKTSLARILAKEINGDSIEEADKLSIHKGEFIDVKEIDAASHTGVDDVRNVLDDTKFNPLKAKYKIYILDEVHMLSKSAFNALLKTLEEPPAHTVFIFATTEFEKIPKTIVSRCQIFKLNRIATNKIHELYKDICQKEDIKIDKEALMSLSSLAGGSIRDGLSLLDQVRYVHPKKNITTKDINLLIGNTSLNSSIKILRSIITLDTVDALNTLDEVYKEGLGIVSIAQGLLKTLSFGIKVLALGKDSDTLLLTTGDVLALKELTSLTSMPALMSMWQLLSNSLAFLSSSSFPKDAFEMLIIKLIYMSKMPSIAEIIAASESKIIPPQAKAKAILPEQPTVELNNSTEDTNNKIDKKILLQLLKSIRKKQELILYQKLLNHSAIINLDDPSMLLGETTLNKAELKQIAEILYEVSGNTWHINKIDSNEGKFAIKILQDDNLKELLTTNFDEYKITDFNPNE